MPPRTPRPSTCSPLVTGETDKYIDQQIEVSRSMQSWAQSHRIVPGAMFLLGDNWYGDMHDGLDSERWKTQFELMYPASDFPRSCLCRLWEIMTTSGNHHDKVDLQLQYPRTRQTRWTMPDHHYTFKYPADNPVITFICLDSNLPGTKSYDFNLFSYTMSHEAGGGPGHVVCCRAGQSLEPLLSLRLFVITLFIRTGVHRGQSDSYLALETNCCVIIKWTSTSPVTITICSTWNLTVIQPRLSVSGGGGAETGGLDHSA